MHAYIFVYTAPISTLPQNTHSVSPIVDSHSVRACMCRLLEGGRTILQQLGIIQRTVGIEARRDLLSLLTQSL